MGRRRNRGRVRIIGGRWRGRRIGFPDVADLRPTPDRVRETLFNWLAPHLDGARVLDMFAGSGILGFEALSRGASSLVAVENDRVIAAQIRDTAGELGAAGFELVVSEAEAFLGTAATPPFDLVFIDPPHAAADYDALCGRLEASALLREHAFVYVEHSKRRAAAFAPPFAWECHRSAQAGYITYQLWRRVSPVSD